MSAIQEKTQTGSQIGDLAPDFTLPDQHGNAVTLSQFRGQKSVVLFFYPKSFSGGCTAEACAFRDSHEVFKEAGAEVIGISTDSVATQDSFAKRYNLTYTLLSDTAGTARKTFKVPKTMGVLHGRVTYVIDKNGIIRHVFNSQMMATKHIDEALETLKNI